MPTENSICFQRVEVAADAFRIILVMQNIYLEKRRLKNYLRGVIFGTYQSGLRLAAKCAGHARRTNRTDRQKYGQLFHFTILLLRRVRTSLLEVSCRIRLPESRCVSFRA